LALVELVATGNGGKGTSGSVQILYFQLLLQLVVELVAVTL
jgi:hypothetical protein